MPDPCAVVYRGCWQVQATSRALDAYTAVMAYELWDLRSRNLIVDFESIDEAVAAVRAYVGANDGDDLLLVELETESRPERSLTGDELMRWLAGANLDQRRTA